MIKVIGKVFDILEMLAEHPTQPRGLGEIAARFKSHPATSANILKELIARNYVEQVAPKKGYLLGPAAYRLLSHGTYRQDMVSAAKPFMTELAGKVNESVLLTVLRNGQRFVLCEISSSQTVQINSDLLFQNRTYATATGRILLAGLDKSKLKTIVGRIGMPDSAWPGIKSLSSLEKELERIRARDWLCIDLPDDAVGLAFPIYQPAGKIAAALGLHLPAYRFKGAHKRAIISGLKQTAREINMALEKNMKGMD